MFARFISSALVFIFSATVLSASSLLWDRTEVRLEMEPDQEEVRAIFNVTNKGEKPVRIARIKTSCGCTGSIVDKKIIQPGETSEIIGTFHKGKRQGLNRNRLQVFIDSQPEAVATLLMNVRVPMLIEATPQVVFWNPESNKSPRRISLTLDERYINEITRIDYDETRLILTEEPGDPKTDVDRVLIIEPKDYGTQYRGMITVYGKGPDGREIDKRVHAFVQP